MCKRKDEGGRCRAYLKKQIEHFEEKGNLEKKEKFLKEYLQKELPQTPPVLKADLTTKAWKRYLGQMREIGKYAKESGDFETLRKVSFQIGKDLEDNYFKVKEEEYFNTKAKRVWCDENLLEDRLNFIEKTFKDANIETGLNINVIKGNKENKEWINNFAKVLPKSLIEKGIDLEVSTIKGRAFFRKSKSEVLKEEKIKERLVEKELLNPVKKEETYKCHDRNGVAKGFADIVKIEYNEEGLATKVTFKEYLAKFSKRKPKDTEIIKWHKWEPTKEEFDRLTSSHKDIMKSGYNIYRGEYLEWNRNNREIVEKNIMKVNKINGSMKNFTTVAHEMTHAIEYSNPEFAKIGVRIRDKIANSIEGNKKVRLMSKGYGRDEIFYKEGFDSVYMGKIYNNDSTEVMSLNMEKFVAPFKMNPWNSGEVIRDTNRDNDKEAYQSFLGSLFIL